MILLHVSKEGCDLPVGSDRWIVAVSYNSLVRWSVPVFVMISGALFLKPEKEIPVNRIFSKYVRRLVFAYIVWYLVYVCIEFTSAWMKTGDVSASIFKPYYHLWFLPMLAGVYLLVPILRVIAERKSVLSYALVLWAIFLTCSFTMIADIPQISQLFVMNIIIGYSGYFLLGYCLSQTCFSKKRHRTILLVGLLGVAMTIAGNILLSYYYGQSDRRFMSNVSPNVVMMSVALFVAVKQQGRLIGEKTRRLIDYLRKDLFGIYLIHGIWLIVFVRPQILYMGSPIVTTPIITVLVFIGSLYTTKLIRRIPFLRVIVK